MKRTKRSRQKLSHHKHRKHTCIIQAFIKSFVCIISISISTTTHETKKNLNWLLLILSKYTTSILYWWSYLSFDCLYCQMYLGYYYYKHTISLLQLQITTQTTPCSFIKKSKIVLPRHFAQMACVKHVHIVKSILYTYVSSFE
jgi:hypothetical protein